MCRYFHLHAPSGCFVNIYAKEARFCFKSELLRSGHVGLLVNNRDQRRKQPGHAVMILLPPRLPLLMTSLIPTARHTQPGSSHSARSSVFITFKCGFVTNRTKDRREKMLRIYCLYHSSVNLLFISLLCESTVYFTPLYSTPL